MSPREMIHAKRQRATRVTYSIANIDISQWDLDDNLTTTPTSVKLCLPSVVQSSGGAGVFWSNICAGYWNLWPVQAGLLSLVTVLSRLSIVCLPDVKYISHPWLRSAAAAVTTCTRLQPTNPLNESPNTNKQLSELDVEVSHNAARDFCHSKMKGDFQCIINGQRPLQSWPDPSKQMFAHTTSTATSLAPRLSYVAPAPARANARVWLVEKSNNNNNYDGQKKLAGCKKRRPTLSKCTAMEWVAFCCKTKVYTEVACLNVWGRWTFKSNKHRQTFGQI